jgi:hypothetical protein
VQSGTDENRFLRDWMARQYHVSAAAIGHANVGAKLSPRGEPDVPGDLLRPLYGNVTEPFISIQHKSGRDVCRGELLA